jgi:adenylate cyclase
MAELIAAGDQPSEQWRRTLPAGQTVILGRDGDWNAPWERWLSRRHAELLYQEGLLQVRQLPTAHNPLYFRGQATACLRLRPGESFVVGTTSFRLSEEPATTLPESQPVLQVRSASAEELARLPFRDAPHHLEVLSRLPGVIASANGEAAFFTQLTNLLLAGMPRADAVALVATEADAATDSPVRVLHRDDRLRSESALQPSQRLVREALGRLRRTVLHVWATDGGAGDQPFTLRGNFDWAFCTPIPGDACKGRGVYVAGRFSGDTAATLLAPWEKNDLGDDLKFAELVAAVVGALWQVLHQTPAGPRVGTD